MKTQKVQGKKKSILGFFEKALSKICNIYSQLLAPRTEQKANIASKI